MNTTIRCAYWTPDELAPRLGVNPNLLRKMCREQKIPARRIGKKLWKIPEKWIRENYPELFEGTTGPAA